MYEPILSSIRISLISYQVLSGRTNMSCNISYTEAYSSISESVSSSIDTWSYGLYPNSVLLFGVRVRRMKADGKRRDTCIKSSWREGRTQSSPFECWFTLIYAFASAVAFKLVYVSTVLFRPSFTFLDRSMLLQINTVMGLFGFFQDSPDLRVPCLYICVRALTESEESLR